jgi:hypothetical protein
MSGLLFLGAVGLWVWACVAMTRWIMRRIGSKPRRLLTGVGVFVLLLVLPVADEIVGGFQFRALCEKNAVFRLGVEKPEGRITRFSADPANEVVPNTAIKIYVSGIAYTDVQSGQLVVKFHRYAAEGGIFIRTLGISQGNAPITMGSSSCSPEKKLGQTVSRTFNFSVIN